MCLCKLVRGFRESVLDDGPTITVGRASVVNPVFLLPSSLTLHDHVAQALWLIELVVALASVTLALVELPLLETTDSDVLTEQHVKGGVDMLEGVIANEDDSIKAFKDHADLCRRVPAVVAACGKVRLVESVSTASAHGVQKSRTVLAVKRVLWGIFVKRNWRYIGLCRFDATVSVSFKV